MIMMLFAIVLVLAIIYFIVFHENYDTDRSSIDYDKELDL